MRVRTVIMPPILRSGTKEEVGLLRSGPVATHRTILGVSCWTYGSGWLLILILMSFGISLGRQLPAN